MVTSAIKSCSNSRAFGPDLLSIFHLKNLGPKATEYLTALFNDSFKSSRIPSIWKTSLVIPIPKPGKDSSQGTSYRPISLLCPAAKVMEALILSTTTCYHLLTNTDSNQPTRPPLLYSSSRLISPQVSTNGSHLNEQSASQST